MMWADLIGINIKKAWSQKVKATID
jgi:hypothetical protein